MIYDTNTDTKMEVREKAKQVLFINAIRFFYYFISVCRLIKAIKAVKLYTRKKGTQGNPATATIYNINMPRPRQE
jgi:hypothetical protein